VIELDFDTAHVGGRRAPDEQASEGRAGDPVEWAVTKSSAVSVSSLPALAVRDRVAIFPSGLPVLKKKGASAAATGVTKPSTAMEIVSFP
jgi:hypothetical protein